MDLWRMVTCGRDMDVKETETKKEVGQLLYSIITVFLGNNMKRLEFIIVNAILGKKLVCT